MERDLAGELLDVLGALVRASRRHERPTSEGVSVPTVRLLSVVSALDAHASVQSVAAAIGVGSPTISRQVQAAQDAGLLTREADARDARRQRLLLTTAGHRAVQEHRDSRLAALQAATDDWSTEELQSLLTSLRRLQAAVGPPVSSPGEPSGGAPEDGRTHQPHRPGTSVG